MFRSICLFIFFTFSISAIGSIISEAILSYEGVSVDSIRFVHNLGLELRPAYVLPTIPFFEGDNNQQKSIKRALSGHLKYSFSLPKGTLGNQIYSETYQGLGVSIFDFGNKPELGAPIAIYLFQRSRIARLSSYANLNYEWNFGLSTKWQPYDVDFNPYNAAIGSHVNAYLNMGGYVNWKVGKNLDLMTGIDLTHFSNGNTNFPNAGLNMIGMKLGVSYDFGDQKEDVNTYAGLSLAASYPRHISYDLVAFGSWRRKGVDFLGEQVASPHRYPVMGAYFAPMYNFGYRFRAGASLDLLYDGSANVYTEDYIKGTEQPFFNPPIDFQLAAGLSARAEYVMPIFTIGIGVGGNILHRGGDLSGTYQTFALKINTTRRSFLHIGYNLKDFHEPNFLMLGLGFRFNNRMPSLLR